MSWIMVGMAAMGVVQGLKNEKKADQARKERSEIIRYSPWTGMNDPGAPQEGGGPLEMGMQGAAMGSSISGKMGPTAPTKTVDPVSSTSAARGPYANSFGGQDMSNQLAQQYGQENVGFDFRPRYIGMK